MHFPLSFHLPLWWITKWKALRWTSCSTTVLGKARRGTNEVKGNVVSTDVNSHRFEYPHSKAFSPKQSLLVSGLLSYNFLVSLKKSRLQNPSIVRKQGQPSAELWKLGEGSEATKWTLKPPEPLSQILFEKCSFWEKVFRLKQSGIA